LLALLIAAIFVLSLTFFSGFLQRGATQKRVGTLDDFVFSVEEDLPRQVFVNGFRTIFILDDRIASTGNYQSNIQDVFQEAFFNGTVYGESQSLLVGTTFSEIEETLRARGRKISANVFITSPNLSVEQNNPWEVRYLLSANLFIDDVAGQASWNKTIVVESLIPIESFFDPLYLVNANGFANSFVQGDFSDLPAHATNSRYVASGDAPSFLQRIEGNFSDSPYGVESFVNLNELSAHGVGVSSTSSVVDHVYFSVKTEGCSVSGMPSWFKIDDEHLIFYGVACA